MENLISAHDYGCRVDTREIYLHSEYESEEPGVDYRSATRFIKNLQFLDSLSKDPISVHLQTTGGCWYYGMAIFDAICDVQSTVRMVGYASVDSIASVILQAADIRVLMPHADVMLHYGSLNVNNEWKAGLAFAEFSKKNTERMLDIYVRRCQHGAVFRNYTAPSVRKYLLDKFNQNGDWWLTAQQAVEHGLADTVMSYDG